MANLRLTTGCQFIALVLAIGAAMTGLAQPDERTELEMKQSGPYQLEVVMSFLDAMSSNDFASALLLIAEDCSYTNGPLGTVTGPAGVKAMLEPFFSPIDENVFEIKRSSVSNSTVFLERLDRHRIGDQWVELPVTGVFEVTDGKISYWADYFDVDTIQNAMASLEQN